MKQMPDGTPPPTENLKTTTPPNGHYKTQDLPLASWLYSNNIPLVDIVNNGPIGPGPHAKPGPARNHPPVYKSAKVFVFEGVPEDLVQKWELGTPQGNVFSFYKAYRYLLRRLKEVS